MKKLFTSRKGFMGLSVLALIIIAIGAIYLTPLRVTVANATGGMSESLFTMLDGMTGRKAPVKGEDGKYTA